MFFVVLKKCMVMFVYMTIGYLLGKSKMLTKAGSRELIHLLMQIISPCMIMQSFMTDRTAEGTQVLLISMVMIVAAVMLAVVMSCLVFRKDRTERFCAAFGNVGYIGLPFVITAMGAEAALYATFYPVFTGVLMWTMGVWMVTGDKQYISLKNALKNPAAVSFFLSVAVFSLNLGGKIPDFLAEPIRALAGMAGPLAMMLMGYFVSSVDLKAVLLNGRYWMVCLFRLVLVGLATALVFALVPDQYRIISQAVYLASITPVGASTATVSELYGSSGSKAAALVGLSTILSIFTMPFMVLAAELIWSL